jgi:hypothetical protein
MMFADEGLVIAKLVEPFDQLHIALESERRIFADPVKRGHEDAEFHVCSLPSTQIREAPRRPNFNAPYADAS